MDFQLQNSTVSLLGPNNINNNSNTTTSYEPLLNEKKYFDDKQSIKPWLHSKLIMKGINIVIERSDDTKIVFKCKNNHNNHQHNSGSKIKTNSKSLVKEVTRRNKTSCPFRIRANYSLRAKKWSIVIVNDQHNHSIYPSNNINEVLSSSANEANKLLKKPVLETSNNKRLNFGPTNSLLMAAQTVNNQQPHQQQMQSPTPPQQQQQISKFQLPLPSNFNQQVHQLTNDSISSRSSSSSSSSSPNPLYSDNSTILSNNSNNKQPIYTAQQSNQQSIQLQQMQQQKLNLLHIDINNLLLHLNTSSNISDSNKEETYNKIIYSLKDILNPSNNVASNNRIITSPTSSSNSPNNNLSLSSNYSYNYKTSNNNAAPTSMSTSTSEKIMLPSLTNSLQGSLQSIRSSPSSSASQQQQPQQVQQQQSSIGINVNSSINNTSSILGNGHHGSGSNNFQQFYL